MTLQRVILLPLRHIPFNTCMYDVGGEIEWVGDGRGFVRVCTVPPPSTVVDAHGLPM
jgi:hypothetical protein